MAPDIFSINRKTLNRFSRFSVSRKIRLKPQGSTRRRMRLQRRETPTSDQEGRALAKLTAELDTSEAPERILRNAIEQAKAWRGQRRRTRKARYEMIQAVYEVYLRREVSRRLRGAIDRECDRQKLRRTKASHPAIVLVKLIVDPPAASVSQYAAAIRQAAVEGIGPNRLAQSLAKKGHGIDAMARRFSNAHPKKRRFSSRQARANNKPVSFDWSSSALKQWQLLPEESNAQLLVQRVSAFRARVVKVKSFKPGKFSEPSTVHASDARASDDDEDW